METVVPTFQRDTRVQINRLLIFVQYKTTFFVCLMVIGKAGPRPTFVVLIDDTQ